MLHALALSLLLAPISTSDVPNPRTTHNGWVTDLAEVIDDEDEQEIERQLTQLNLDLGTEVAVVTVESASLEPKDFATELFNAWGIGSAEKNDGLLILLVMDRRRLEMETGYGLEAVLPDAWLGSMQQRDMVPEFKRGDFGRGILMGVEEVVARLHMPGALPASAGVVGNEFQPLARVSTERPWYARIGWGGWLSGLLTMLLGTSVWYWRRRQYRHCTACDTPRSLLDESEEDEHLSAGQQSEEELDSVHYDVWVCPGCSSVAVDRKRRWFSGMRECPSCENRTCVYSSYTLEPATRTSTGTRRETKECYHCDFSYSTTSIIPRLPEPSTTSYSSTSSWSSGGGGFSGGSSFGGGSSGGGGAGSSW